MNKPLNQYQQIVKVGMLPPDDLATVVALLLEHLKLEIVREWTPDYLSYELRQIEP